MMLPGVGNLKHRRPNGFTAVELIVASLAASILILASAAALFYGFLGWERNRDSVNLQQEGAAALDMMVRRVRGVAVGEIQVGSRAGGTEVRIKSTNAFYHQPGAGTLLFDPDTSVADDERVMVDGTVLAFTATTNELNGLRLQLVLGDDTQRMTLKALVACRVGP